MRKKLSMVAAGLVLAAPIAWAQDELAPAPSVEAAVKADPTLEVLRGELKPMDDDPQDRAARQNFHTLVALLTWAF